MVFFTRLYQCYRAGRLALAITLSLLALIAVGCPSDKPKSAMESTRLRAIQVTPAAGEQVGPNSTVDIKLTFSEALKVGGKPMLPFKIGGSMKSAPYQELLDDGRTVLFRYQVQEGDAGPIHTSADARVSLGADGFIKDSLNKPVSLVLGLASKGGQVISSPSLGVSGKTPDPGVTMPEKNAGPVDTTAPQATGVTITPEPVVTVPAENAGPVDTAAPQATGVTISPDTGTTIGLAGNIDISLTFNEDVEVSGKPTLALEIGPGQGRRASYRAELSTRTTLLFRYQVVASDGSGTISALLTAQDAIAGGSIVDLAGNAADLAAVAQDLAAGQVDLQGPVIERISVSPDATVTVGENAVVTFTVTFDAAVVITGAPAFSFALQAGSGSETVKTASYAAAATADINDAKVAIFTYPVQLGDNGNIVVRRNIDGITPSANIEDAFGNRSTDLVSVQQGSGGTVDTSAPSMSGVTISPATDSRVGLGAHIDFTLHFSEVVSVTGAATPLLPFFMGSDRRNAIYQGGSDTNALRFRHTVVSGENGKLAIKASDSLDLGSGSTSIQDAQGNRALLTLLAESGGTVDTTGPQATSVTISPATDSSVGLGAHIDFTLHFSEVVRVTGAATPSLPFFMGSDRRNAIYQGGSDTSTLRFRHTVVSGENGDITIKASDSLDLGSGSTSIQDAQGNRALLTLLAESGGTVDTIAPRISGVTIDPPSDRRLSLDGELVFSVKFSEAVKVTGTPRLSFSIGGSGREARYHSGGGSDELRFTYKVARGDSGRSETTNSHSLVLNSLGASIRDIPGNASLLSLQAARGSQIDTSEVNIFENEDSILPG